MIPGILDAAFATTHWSVVLAAAGEATPAARQAWEHLARSCWQPLYVHARRHGRNHEDAQDVVQAFFKRLLERPVLRAAQRERGRFRTFLLSSFDHFLANDYDRTMALKRGGGLRFEPLHEVDAPFEPASADVPQEQQFDTEFARGIFERALQRLEGEFDVDGKSSQFTALAPLLCRPPEPGEYERLAQVLGIRPGLMATATLRLRRRYYELIRAEVAAVVATPAELNEELSYLVGLLSR
ncbi:MAG: sigma-70 family RNA polymerase sigma factor [Verrucomicrobiales bacterium]|nr:sigma-70 family RNA polymerase sigma factor [Verrucomicrobiales bacterium]